MRLKRQLEHSNELWPVLEVAPLLQKRKKKTKKEIMPRENGEAAGTVMQEPPKDGVTDENSEIVAQGTEKNHKENEGCGEKDIKNGEGNDESSVEEEGGSEDSSSEEEEAMQDMAKMQHATPGAAYTMIRRLRYPIESANITAWFENVSQNEEHKKAQVNAYNSMCALLKSTPVGLSAIKGFIDSKTADTLSIPGINWGVNQVTAFAGIMKGEDVSGSELSLLPVMRLRTNLEYNMLQHLDCCNNNMGGLGVDQLFDALLESKVRLKSLNISRNNLGESGAKSLAHFMAIKDSPMVELIADENHFGDRGSANVLQVVSSLKSLRRLSLKKNKIGRKGSCELSKLLTECTSLEELDVCWNEIRGTAAVKLCAGLEQNTTLRRLSLQWNSFGDPICMHALADALGKCQIKYLDLGNNRIGAPGSALLANGLELNTSLMHLTLDGNPLTMQGAREILRTSSEKIPRTFSVEKCSFARHPGVQFDPAEPAGAYLLDLKDPYSHRILKNLIRYQLAGNGAFDNATPCVLKATVDDGEGRNFKAEFPSELEAVFPKEGFFEFNFLDRSKGKPKDSTMNPMSLQMLVQQINKQTMSVADRLDVIRTIIGDGSMSLQQAESILKQVNTYQPTDRVNLFCSCYHRIVNVDDSKETLTLLTTEERRMVEKQIGKASLAFYPNNPTGHYKLDLALPAHRDMLLRLIQLRNEMEELESGIYKYYDNRGGGKRDISAIGVVWRNGKLQTAPFTLQQSWQVPYCGLVEVDFVDIRRPPQDVEPLTDTEFCDLILSSWDEKSGLLSLQIISNNSMVRILREVTNTRYVSCKQVARMIGRFDPSRAALIRIEIIIACWARTIDYHGLTNVLALLTPPEQAAVIHRLGPLQTFDEMMAVGFYELNLEIPGERFVFQELVHLAGTEPGEPEESMLQMTINGKAAELNKDWLVGGIPEHSVITAFFVRTQACLDRVFEKGAFAHNKRQPPESSKSVFMETYLYEFCKQGFCSPGGEDWIKPFTYRRVRRKMGVRFAAPEHAFYALDDDDSGSLTRPEVGAGLESVLHVFSIVYGHAYIYINMCTYTVKSQTHMHAYLHTGIHVNYSTEHPKLHLYRCIVVSHPSNRTPLEICLNAV